MIRVYPVLPPVSLNDIDGYLDTALPALLAGMRRRAEGGIDRLGD